MIHTTSTLFGMLPVDFVAAVFQKRLADPLDRRQWEAKGMKFPNGIENGPVIAEVNQSRWVVNCPFCAAGGEMVDPADPRFFCLSCFNKENGSQWITVSFPKEREEIEALIDSRADDDWKNWHGESVQELIAQNEQGFHHSWTAPRTWVTGEIVSAANMNTHVRDNFLETAVAKASAAGQIPYATAANAIAMLTAAAYRMPRFNSTANAIEAIAGLNLAQAPVFASVSAINASTVAGSTILSQSFTTHGGIVIVFGYGRIGEAKSAASVIYSHFISLDIDSVVVGGQNIVFVGGAGATGNTADYPAVPLLYMHTPAAAVKTYKVTGSYGASSTSGTPLAYAGLVLVELAP